MSTVVSAIKKTIPISQFNRGLAGQIFSEVKAEGSKVVMKNNMAEAVLVSPDEYVEMMDTINDYLLLTMAVERMSAYNPNNLVPEVEMERKLNITQEDLDAAGEVEIE